MPDFTDKDDIERWLQDKPQSVAVALAARSALRCLPAVLAEQTTITFPPNPRVKY